MLINQGTWRPRKEKEKHGLLNNSEIGESLKNKCEDEKI